jgi:tetratricopeptide (TPR) repeat protein
MHKVEAPRIAFGTSNLSILMTLVVAVSATAQTSGSAQSRFSSTARALPKSCLTQNHSSEKIAAMLETIRDHPTAGAYNTLGVLYAQVDAVACAVAAFEASLRLENQNWEAHYNLALVLTRRGDRSRSERELQAAILQKPDSVSSHFALGTLFADEKRFVLAEQEFRSALKVDPAFTPGALKLSQALIAEGKTQAAVNFLEETAKQTPPDQGEQFQAALGLAYAENGDTDKGFRTLKNLVASQPNSALPHFNLGLLYATQNQPADATDAATEFGQALQLDGSMDAARLALGRVLISLGKYSDAVPVLIEYTRHQPQDAQGFYVLGRAYQGLQRLQQAMGAFRHAATLDPMQPAIRFSLGVVLASAGKTSDAIQQFSAAERMNPSDPEIHEQLASLFEKTGDKERARVERSRLAALKTTADKEGAVAKLNAEANQYLLAGNAKSAAESYRKAMQINPRDAKLHYNLALALDKLGDFPSEQKELERAVELDPKLAAAQNQLGLLALRSGQQAVAAQHFRKTLAIDPRFAEAQNSLGVLYSKQGKDDEARSLFEQAIQNDPRYTQAYVNLGLLMAQHGLAEAEQQFRLAIQIEPSSPGAYAALGMLQAKTGRGGDAVKSFQKAVALEPQSAQAHLNLGIALVDQFNRADGFHEFSEAARLDPNLAAAHYNLGRFFFETGKYEDAGRELETALHLQPDFADALYFLALTAKQENQSERATAFLQKVVSLQPGNADAQYLLGQNLEHSGDTAGAIRHWKAALQADPNHSQALFNLAKVLNKTHDAEAEQYQDRFEALQKNQQITDRVAELGNFALEAANAQNWPQALQQMNEAIQLCGNCPQSAHLHKNLGLFYGRTGNINQAEKELRMVLQLTPNDSGAQSALAAFEHAQGPQ